MAAEPCSVDSGDLLLGILEEGHGNAITILQSFGLDLAMVRDRTLARVDSNSWAGQTGWSNPPIALGVAQPAVDSAAVVAG